MTDFRGLKPEEFRERMIGLLKTYFKSDAEGLKSVEDFLQKQEGETYYAFLDGLGHAGFEHYTPREAVLDVLDVYKKHGDWIRELRPTSRQSVALKIASVVFEGHYSKSLLTPDIIAELFQHRRDSIPEDPEAADKYLSSLLGVADTVSSFVQKRLKEKIESCLKSLKSL